MDFAIRKEGTSNSMQYYGCFVWCEGNDSIMKIKTKAVEYEEKVTLPQSDIILSNFGEIEETTLYSYITGKPPIERVSEVIVGLDPDLDYMVKLITSEYNPRHPQLITIDGEEMGIVYGQAGQIDTTEIFIPKEMIQDKKIVIDLDRVKGNPNRVAELLFYEMNLINNETINASLLDQLKFRNKNKIIDFDIRFEYNGKKPKIIYSIPVSGKIELDIFDVTGRKVITSKYYKEKGKYEYYVPDEIGAGVYFSRLKIQGNEKTIKLIKLQ